MSGSTRIPTMLVLSIGVVLTVGSWAHDAKDRHTHGHDTPAQTPTHEPVRISMEALHQHGGVPPGWRFTVPAGDPDHGRTAFTKLGCHQCHTIQGEPFPQASQEASASGPELTGMGGHHPAEYFAESILNPNAVIVTGPGYTDAQGFSTMPDYRASVTVEEWIDVVAYLKSLDGGHDHSRGMEHGQELSRPSHPTAAEGAVEQVVGDYRIRLAYQEAEVTGLGHGAHGQSHLVVSITDVQTGAPVPYLPVSATIDAGRKTPRTVKLMPMLSDQGFHYGTETTLPKTTSRITLAIGATTMRVMPPMVGRFATPRHVSFRWGSQPPSLPTEGSRMPGVPGHRHGPSGEQKGH